MNRSLNYLAVDLGAESGRAMLGRFDGNRLAMTEVHRFGNEPVHVPDKGGRVSLHWDILRLFAETKQGLAKAARQCDGDLSSVGLDSWGVDFGLLDRSGALIGNPYHHRDSRTDDMLEEAFRRVPQDTIFRQTGIQFLQINSLYQLLAMVVADSPALQIARTFLTIPDLLNYWLTGVAVSEYTNATTTQCYNVTTKEWAKSLLDKMGIPSQIFPDIILPGSSLGALLPAVAKEAGLAERRGVPVVAPACHDTGSAAVAVPAEQAGFAWISSGTWSTVGAECLEPAISDQSLAYNFTNEGGVCGTFRLLRNVMGLWLVQECRREWERRGELLTHSELLRLAEEVAPFQAVIDPDNSAFLKPGNMPERVQDFCRRTGQQVPASTGEIVRCVLEGLALKYRFVLEHLEDLVGRRLDPIHIVGGGSQNRLLNQFAAEATGRRVVAGPVEATAIGNVIMQAMAAGHIKSLAEGRALVRESFPPTTFAPVTPADWEEPYRRLLRVMAV
ncbi:MAG: rhamnulokinase [Acidimicrobiales bacterium]|jgi:rhamnulokinase